MYPLKFIPILKEMIWGGSKLNDVFGKTGAANPDRVGESWEISDVEGNASIVSNGVLKGEKLNELMQSNAKEILGDTLYKQFGQKFPLLVKIIDANDNLSVQVHPDDQFAKAKHNSFGKTEMWYILDHEQGAHLVSGFVKPIDKQEYQARLANNTIEEVLAKQEVKKGEGFFIPAGRVHAICKGIVLAEIQQTSDLTYRIYDYNRKDPKTGLPRQLHTELAAEVINYSDTQGASVKIKKISDEINEVVKTTFFTVNTLEVNGTLKRDYSAIESFIILMGLEGEGEIVFEGSKEKIKMGDTVLIPYSIKDKIEFSGKAKLLESYI